jgi:hypothetical protein
MLEAVSKCSRRKTLPRLAVLATVGLLAVTGCGAATQVSSGTVPGSTSTAPPSRSSGGDARVAVVANCQDPVRTPATIILGCPGGAIVATQIKWANWGSSAATGTAVIRAQLCHPNCAQGSEGAFAAEITLSHVVGGASGPVFSILTAKFAGASPTGKPIESFALGRSGSAISA